MVTLLIAGEWPVTGDVDMGKHSDVVHLNCVTVTESHVCLYCCSCRLFLFVLFNSLLFSVIFCPVDGLYVSNVILT